MLRKVSAKGLARFACTLTCVAGLGVTPAHSQFQHLSGDISDLEAMGPERVVPPKALSVPEAARMREFLRAFAPAPSAVVTTLSMPEGEKVDCVYRDAQPSLLNRPHQTLQERPSFEIKDPRPSSPSPSPQSLQSYGTATMMCPEGTIPIQRLSFETLARFGTLKAFRSKEGRARTMRAGPTDLHQYAVVYRYVPNWGAESILNLWNPYTELSSEFSLSQIWVVRGNAASTETVEAGWQKYRDLYGDWNARLFIYFTPDNYGSGGCYNLTCGKFVQTDNSVYIGGAFTNYSSANGPQYVAKLLWYKDGTTGHWWLRYFDTWVGYYPRDLFDAAGLRDQADLIEFGGEIINDLSGHPGRHTATDMGSGYWPYQGYGLAAYQRAVRYVDTSNFYQRATNLTPIITDRSCYDLLQYSAADIWEEYFFFGGSGYNSECQ